MHLSTRVILHRRPTKSRTVKQAPIWWLSISTIVLLVVVTFAPASSAADDCGREEAVRAVKDFIRAYNRGAPRHLLDRGVRCVVPPRGPQHETSPPLRPHRRPSNQIQAPTGHALDAQRSPLRSSPPLTPRISHSLSFFEGPAGDAKAGCLRRSPRIKTRDCGNRAPSHSIAAAALRATPHAGQAGLTQSWCVGRLQGPSAPMFQNVIEHPTDPLPSNPPFEYGIVSRLVRTIRKSNPYPPGLFRV